MSGDSAGSPTGPPPRARLSSVVIAALIALLVVWAGIFYFETRPGPGPTDVSLEGIGLSTNYTNSPAGQAPPHSFEVYFAWFINSSTESPTVASLHAPAGSIALLHLSIDYELDSGTQNCTVSGIAALPPFGIASMFGGLNAGGTSQPLPMNFSGATVSHNPSAFLDLNVSLPDTNGVYTPMFVMSATCGQY